MPAAKPTTGRRKRTRKITAGRRAAARQSLRDELAARAVTHGRLIRGKFDIAQTTDHNSAHWAQADSLSADSAASQGIRQTIRNRARYEQANNSYCRGMTLSLANHTIGTGPRLQMLGSIPDANRQTERAWSVWSRRVRLAETLRKMRIARAVDGESFLLPITGPADADGVTLDLWAVETEQISTPDLFFGTENAIDGIEFDQYGRPKTYHLLKYHPGDLSTWSSEYTRIPADRIIHYFRATRAGQHRGLPDIAPALPLFAVLRRFTLAALGAAEIAADLAGVFYTDSPQHEPDEYAAMDSVELESRAFMTLPMGWKMNQLKAEQPPPTYGEFKAEVLNEIARCLDMPYNVAAGNSSKYNYSSGRLDWQNFFKALEIERDHINLSVVEPIFQWWLAEYLATRSGIRPSDLDLSRYPHEWHWDGIEHVDPAKEAIAQGKRLKNQTTTLSYEYARQGRDWETALRQRAREIALQRELGLIDDPAAKPEPQPTG